jgi:hypothetical protein
MLWDVFAKKSADILSRRNSFYYLYLYYSSMHYYYIKDDYFKKKFTQLWIIWNCDKFPWNCDKFPYRLCSSKLTYFLIWRLDSCNYSLQLTLNILWQVRCLAQYIFDCTLLINVKQIFCNMFFYFSCNRNFFCGLYGN